MCGIAGIVARDPGARIDEHRLARMRDALHHRGPDGNGLRVDGPAGLAHTRLAIVDVAHGEQPMSNETGDVWVVFNGEIYTLSLHDALPISTTRTDRRGVSNRTPAGRRDSSRSTVSVGGGSATSVIGMSSVIARHGSGATVVNDTAGAGWRQPYAADTHPRGGSSSPHDITVSTGVDAIGSIHSACPRRVSARIHGSGPAVRRTSGAN